MKTDNRVAWTEGMFLRVQHFQQADRWTERLVQDTMRPLVPYPWGVTALTIDRAALEIGRFAVTAISGILPDGTPFAAPGPCDVPAPIELREGVTDALVYLTLPMQRPGASSFAQNGEDLAARHMRMEFDAEDANAGSAFSAPISVGRLRLGMKLSSDETAGFERIALARIVEVRPDLAVVLDEEHVAPCLSVGAQQRLAALLTELVGLVRHRADAVARRIADPSMRGAAELGDYLMLQALNRAGPLLTHLQAQAAQVHPEALYRTLVSLAGELATFAAANRSAAEFPAYKHEDLQASFEPVVADLRQSLSTVLDRSALPIPLEERRYGVKVATLADPALRDKADFVLAVRADMAGEELRRRLPNQIKIGPVERISELVNVALPGVDVRAMPVAPRQLPYAAGTVYFELETDGAMWGQVRKSATLAIHLAETFPGIEMELWGIRG
ncbi:MAG: type VI secretion system baseplate subunit TssK [Pseudomonadota bacterium]